MGTPWLTIIGLGEDGLDGLTSASRKALDEAEVIFGAERHLQLLDEGSSRHRAWPVPFANGIAELLAVRGRRSVLLASGDPFWFGAGSVITALLERHEWRSFAGVSTFALAANHLGWPLEKTDCLGLHAQAIARLRPHLQNDARILVLVRNAEAATEVAEYLTQQGFGASQMHILEALGGPRQRARCVLAQDYNFDDVQHPVCLGLMLDGEGLPLGVGLPDAFYAHDGQITKSVIRAVTLAALTPRKGERLWDIGGGSGSIAIEWLRHDPAMRAICIEKNPERAERLMQNARDHGVDWLEARVGDALEEIADLPAPDAVFVGGGMSEALLHRIWAQLPKGARLVANAVTLEGEAMLSAHMRDKGGHLTRIDLAQAQPLGRKFAWKHSYPIVQWSARR